MPYDFSFDLSSMPSTFFAELATIASENSLRRRLEMRTRHMAQNLTKITGMEMPHTLRLVEDLVDVYSQNFSERRRFEETKNRALLLPHCARKYMDGRCKAAFNPEIPSYTCNQCSEDCIINEATRRARGRGYNVYVLPGGSCVNGILRKNRYDGILGVACAQEARLVTDGLRRMGFAGQAIPLTKNGCANTDFNVEFLTKML